MSDDERAVFCGRETERERERERERTDLKRTNIYCICESEHVRRVWRSERASESVERACRRAGMELSVFVVR